MLTIIKAKYPEFCKLEDQENDTSKVQCSSLKPDKILETQPYDEGILKSLML